MNNFRVGQRVVCVHPEMSGLKTANGWSGNLLQYGRIYTVTDIGIFVVNGNTHIDVAEVSTPHALAWEPARFRPAVERKTDISIFTRMLTDDKVDA